MVGGGIGGLPTAIALDRAGWEVDVFERQERFFEIGASLTLWPNVLAAAPSGSSARAASFMTAAHVSSPIAVRLRDVSLAAVPQSVNLWMMKPDWAWTPDRIARSPAP